MDILRYVTVEKQQQAPQAAAVQQQQATLCVKYAPKSMRELDAYLPSGLTKKTVDWMRAVVNGHEKSIALVVGPSGSMKGCLVKLASAMLGREPKSIAAMAADPTLVARQGASLVVTADAMDGFDGTSLDSIKQLARTHPRLPIVVYSYSLLYGRVAELRRQAIILEAGPPSQAQLVKYAEAVLRGERLDMSRARQLVAMCSPDFSQVANAIALNAQGGGGTAICKKDSREDALTLIRQHMLEPSSHTVATTYHAFVAEGGLFTSLVAENYLDAEPTIEAAAAAAEDVSAGDTMEASLYATQNWSMLGAWVMQGAVMPCHKVAASSSARPPAAAAAAAPRFSKLWSSFSNAAQRASKYAQVRHALVEHSHVFHASCMDISLAIASMTWSIVQRQQDQQALYKLLAGLSIGPQLAHHLARIAGKASYKSSHHKWIKACLGTRP